ncbi:hypothetical protein AGOR_G00173360 [Albula goreensis]|uniref:E3 ubiquitin-protein ligase TRIM39-like n=1 Tax=Albula goreensis TaxID=1534307 RepID=A0A8T3CZS4_9TELE|nr:hypothetical protein AGOR_G00173360 [Albula goreensis]
MASPSIIVSEGQFQCSICLDVFTDPVSTPCGHNFCMACIGGYWDSNNPPQCPLCKEKFETRPKLCVNKSFAEIVEEFKRSTEVKSNLHGTLLPPTLSDVFCDVCTEQKLKAVKSCLVCMTSYCEEHLSLHRFSKHKLFDPVSMEDRMCKQHERLLEVFCENDQMCVCTFCAEKNHRTHSTVPVERTRAERMNRLGKTEAEIKEMIQERLKKVEEIKQTVELSKSNAEREIEASVQVFSALMQAIERSQAELVETIEEKQKAAEKRAEGYIEELEEEIVELRKRIADLEQLSDTDHIYFLQSFPYMCTAPTTKDLSHITLYGDPCVGTVRRALSHLVEIIIEEERRFSAEDLGRIQQYAADVTVDTNTNHPSLVLSVDGKQLRHGIQRHFLSNNPERFDFTIASLGMQKFGCGRHYWEVEVGEKTEWNLGVAKESVDRKGPIVRSPEKGFWTLWLSNVNEYYAYTEPPVQLPLSAKPTKIGVYLDYEGGCVSFYDVEAKLHIYTFSDCNFTNNLCPYLNPGRSHLDNNATPLIITPVILTH